MINKLMYNRDCNTAIIAILVCLIMIALLRVFALVTKLVFYINLFTLRKAEHANQ